eukprot:Blabericola_migrator_1__8961@NODE_4761_length_991_cov_987_916667_g2931_i1_p1_GENE_NODE_4761_length_991_cov_987_916667_g2931_i1NODE_4761_length_991_cov_987_916667_g2931_i1_p1_ORF_typecomplete_len262_score22_57KAR9/PF08580_10/0_25CTD/PF12815_7/2_5_NODE_4761_length_991_cov_987_916667_g2931_i134819
MRFIFHIVALTAVWAVSPDPTLSKLSRLLSELADTSVDAIAEDLEQYVSEHGNDLLRGDATYELPHAWDEPADADDRQAEGCFGDACKGIKQALSPRSPRTPREDAVATSNTALRNSRTPRNSDAAQGSNTPRGSKTPRGSNTPRGSKTPRSNAPAGQAVPVLNTAQRIAAAFPEPTARRPKSARDAHANWEIDHNGMWRRKTAFNNDGPYNNLPDVDLFGNGGGLPSNLFNPSMHEAYGSADYSVSSYAPIIKMIRAKAY